MSAKIIDLNDHDPKKGLAEMLAMIPTDVAFEYVGHIGKYIDDTLKLRNIVSLADNPRLTRFMMDQLNDSLLDRLSSIAHHLASVDPAERVKEIVEASTDLFFPTEESRSKAVDLINIVNSFNGNLKDKSNDLAVISRRYQVLANIFAVIDMGIEFEKLMIDRFSKEYTEELDQLIKIVKDEVLNGGK